MRPLFIGGTGRSGTTVTRSILGFHPKILALPNEFRINVDPDGLIDLYESLTIKWSPYEADIAIKRFEDIAKSVLGNMFIRRIEQKVFSILGISPRRYTHFGEIILDKKSYLESLKCLIEKLKYNNSKGFWFGTPAYTIAPIIYETKYMNDNYKNIQLAINQFFESIYLNYSKSKNLEAPVFGIDDTPYSILSANRLLELYPDSFFLHVYRDPRDVICSYKTMRWGGNDISIIANKLASVYTKWNQVKEGLDPNSYHELSMESMADNQEKAIIKILKKLSLPEYKDFNKIEVSNKSINRYKQELTKKELSIVETILKDNLRYYGYK